MLHVRPLQSNVVEHRVRATAQRHHVRLLPISGLDGHDHDSLLLARAASRQKEFAIRAALGASRLRVIGQLLTESLLLAAFGGWLGVLLACWAVNGINAFYPISTRFAVDVPVLGFAAGASLLTGLLVGLMPSLRALKSNVNDALKEGAQKSPTVRGRWFQDFLVAGEIALALILLCGAGLLIQSFLRYEAIDKGYDPINEAMSWEWS